ncbi:SPOR domain-containing protein [Virgibacillus sp. LDC1]|uniref:SPOR domain-containing protein n=1 Tax=Paenibacillus lautus TaxID=1401 RepID=UPI002DB85359|nr:SPOR domain-containing protein [Paenibacillus lautus]MCV4234962.1 SPOR domain-containing protein [Virgibacillus sp. LDC1]MEC0259037.1 SPOR domain-containing protein [Paenibacillus lautus]
MNKARMTIRFDHDPPKDSRKDHLREERDSYQKVPVRRNGQVDNGNLVFDEFDTTADRFTDAGTSFEHRNSMQHDHLRVVSPLRDEGDIRDVDGHEWGTSRQNRPRGRLAEERRRLDHVHNDGAFGDGFDHTDTYDDLREREDLYDLHDDGYSGKMDPEANDSNWNLGPGSALYESSADDYSYYRSRKPTSFWKMAVSVTAAVVTGLLFGYMVLSMFNGGNAGEDPASGQLESHDAVNQAPADSSGGKGVSLAPDLTESTVRIPGQVFYMLQYGVFSTPERADQAKGELLQSGIAAGGDLDEENRVYAGISPDREQAKLLSNQLKAEGVELYVREIALPGIESAAFAGEEQTLTDYFTISGQLVSELSTLSASLLGKQEAGAVASENMATITDLHQQWIQSMKLLSAGLGPETGAVLPAMEQSMNSSITALSEYNKNQSKGHLWEIQTGMMNYVMGQKKLLDGL